MKVYDLKSFIALYNSDFDTAVWKTEVDFIGTNVILKRRKYVSFSATSARNSDHNRKISVLLSAIIYSWFQIR